MQPVQPVKAGLSARTKAKKALKVLDEAEELPCDTEED
jgi:hypothetical protein